MVGFWLCKLADELEREARASEETAREVQHEASSVGLVDVSPALTVANDTPEVMVEIRAAEIAADPGRRMNLFEWSGYHELWHGDCQLLVWSYAGYLARCIVGHGDAP